MERKEHKLSEIELNEIGEEAEKIYPVSNYECIDKEQVNLRIAYVNGATTTLTRERERAKGLVDITDAIVSYLDGNDLNAVCSTSSFHIMLKTALSNYQKSKEQ